jgi:hypothetical protein
MPSSDTVRVFARPYSNCLRLEWWAKEGRNDHERRADQYAPVRGSEPLPLGPLSGSVYPDPHLDPALTAVPAGPLGEPAVLCHTFLPFSIGEFDHGAEREHQKLLAEVLKRVPYALGNGEFGLHLA